MKTYPCYVEIEQKLKQYSHEITLNKRLLANSYNIREIEQLEGQVRDKNSECNKIKKENKRIKKWIKQNEKLKANINENGFYDDEVYKLKNELRTDKAKIRELYYDTLRKRKLLIEKHEVVVKRDNNIRKMKEIIEASKKEKQINHKNLENARPESVVVGKKWDLDEMKKKVDFAKSQLKKEQNHIDREVNHQEDKIKEGEHQLKLISLKVKEKDKELSLAYLKIKELKRNERYNSLKPLPSTPGNSTSRRKRQNQMVYRSIDGTLVKRKNGKNGLSGKRNSTEAYTRISTNNEKYQDKKFISNEIRLEKESESSILMNSKR